MKIKEVLSAHRNDFTAMMECEHCESKQKLTTGYDDAYYHGRVIPAMTCNACKKNRAGETVKGLPASEHASPMKPCTKCQTPKPLCEFRKSNRTKDGLDTQCKACRQAKAKTAEARNNPSTLANWARGTMAKLHLTDRDYS